MTISSTDTASYSLQGQRVWVAGHRGMLGQALVRRLAEEDCSILSVPKSALDLRHQLDVDIWMRENEPHVVFVAAGTVGGILANSGRPWDFLHDNLAIASNIIEAARKHGVPRLIYVASSCMYPKMARQPISEDQLLSGALEPTNRWYAMAKIAGVMMTQALRQQHALDYISVTPTNLYGPEDDFDLQDSHVLPALLRKIHEAKVEGAPSVAIWGSGTPQREFLHVDDCADACVHLAKHYSGVDAVNVGTDEEVSIKALAEIVAEIVGFRGHFEFDESKPDGTPRKKLNLEKLHRLGWKHRISLKDGIRETYDWYLSRL